MSQPPERDLHGTAHRPPTATLSPQRRPACKTSSPETQKERKKFYIDVGQFRFCQSLCNPVPARRGTVPLAAGRRQPNKKVCRLTKEVIVVTSNLKPSPECTPAAPRTLRYNATPHQSLWIKSRAVHVKSEATAGTPAAEDATLHATPHQLWIKSEVCKLQLKAAAAVGICVEDAITYTSTPQAPAAAAAAAPPPGAAPQAQK